MYKAKRKNTDNRNKMAFLVKYTVLQYRSQNCQFLIGNKGKSRENECFDSRKKRFIERNVKRTNRQIGIPDRKQNRVKFCNRNKLKSVS